MINDLKLGLKIIKYGLNFKGCVFITVPFLIIGILMDAAIPASPINGMYIGMCGMMILQCVYSVSVSDMVQSSSRKRQLQTSVPAIICGGYLLLGNTISIISKVVGLKVRFASALVLDWGWNDIANAILAHALLMVLIVLYMAGAMKAFWQATVGFVIFYLGYFFLSLSLLLNVVGERPFILPIGAAVAVSYIMVIVAAVLIYFIFVAMYKRDFSKHTFGIALKRAK